MSAVQRSIGSRLLSASLRPSTARAIAPKYRTYANASNEPEPKTSPNEAPNAPLEQSSLQDREQGAAEAVRHKPDYNVAIDYRTSYGFPGVPRRGHRLTSRTATSPPFLSVSWMAASPEIAWLQQSSLVRPSICRPGQCGTSTYILTLGKRKVNESTASTAQPRPPPSLEIGTHTTG